MALHACIACPSTTLNELLPSSRQLLRMRRCIHMQQSLHISARTQVFSSELQSRVGVSQESAYVSPQRVALLLFIARLHKDILTLMRDYRHLQ